MRKQQPQNVSPLLKGGLFGPSSNKTSRKKASVEPGFASHLNSYSEMLTSLLKNLSVAADSLYPNTKFLSEVPGSKIEKGVRLSYILSACFGLSPMKLNPALVENYKQTLKSYLNGLPRNSAEYSQLLNLIKTFEAVANCMKHCSEMKNELERLSSTLGLPPKTVDKRLRNDWAELAITAPVGGLANQIDKLLSDMQKSGASPSIRNALSVSTKSLQSFAQDASTKPPRGQQASTPVPR